MSLATFQSTVFINQGFGVPGEMFTDAPFQVQTYTINSAEQAYNIIGATACTVTSQGFCQAGSGGSFGFAGILVNPKNQALFGFNGIPLEPTLQINNYSPAALATMGVMIVTLPASCNIGDYVVYNNTTGVLSTISPTTPLPSGYSFANAIVTNFTPSTSGTQLAVITINPTYIIPQPV